MCRKSFAVQGANLSGKQMQGQFSASDDQRKQEYIEELKAQVLPMQSYHGLD